MYSLQLFAVSESWFQFVQVRMVHVFTFTITAISTSAQPSITTGTLTRLSNVFTGTFRMIATPASPITSDVMLLIQRVIGIE